MNRVDRLYDALVVRVHVGSGPVAIPGWTNVDLVKWPGVDIVLDVREGLPFTNIESVFAEHFLEHLTLAEGLSFLRSCRRALCHDGILRLSTPNLDWVWLTHYKRPEEMSGKEPYLGCLEINRAFHGWGHQFLYNGATLELALRAAGFCDIVPHTYGDSRVVALRNLERHERHQDLAGHPSVLIVEASGVAEPTSELTELIAPYLPDFAAR